MKVMKPLPYDNHSSFPYYATPKVDGIRFFIENHAVYSASNKLIPNRHIQSLVPLLLPNGTDGELLIGDHFDPLHFQNTTSVVMSESNTIDDLVIYAFDYVDPYTPREHQYQSRIQYLSRWFKSNNQLFLSGEFVCHTGMKLSQYPNNAFIKKIWESIQVLTPTAIRKPEHIETYLQQCLSQGYEGIILRDPRSVYVEGRVKASDPTFLKYKPLIDSEAVIIGFEEQLHNGNEAFISENGRTKRSSSIIGKTPANTLGAFIVRWGDVEFTIGGGIGLTAELRKEIWNNREQYLGKLIKFSYLGCGTKDKPRMPKFLGFRHPDDISH